MSEVLAKIGLGTISARVLIDTIFAVESAHEKPKLDACAPLNSSCKLAPDGVTPEL